MPGRSGVSIAFISLLESVSVIANLALAQRSPPHTRKMLCIAANHSPNIYRFLEASERVTILDPRPIDPIALWGSRYDHDPEALFVIQ